MAAILPQMASLIWAVRRRGIKNFSSRRAVCILAAMQRGTVRRTKIISTLGPATDSAEMIGKLIDAGVNIFRLNMSHAPHDWVRRVVRGHPRRSPPSAHRIHRHHDGHARPGHPHRRLERAAGFAARPEIHPHRPRRTRRRNIPWTSITRISSTTSASATWCSSTTAPSR